MNSQKVYHCGARCATLRNRESAIPIHLSMRRNRCGSHRHHNHAAHAPNESRRQRCADDATRLFHIARRSSRQLVSSSLTAPADRDRRHPSLVPLPLPHVVRLSRGGAARAADRYGSEDAPPPDVKHGRAAPPDVGRPAEHARGEFGGGEQPWRGRRRGARRLGWHPEGVVRDLSPLMPPTLGGGRRDEHDGPPELGERVKRARGALCRGRRGFDFGEQTGAPERSHSPFPSARAVQRPNRADSLAIPQNRPVCTA